MPASEIDDGKPAMPEKNIAIVPKTTVIRSAMDQHTGHARQSFAIARPDETGDAAHLIAMVQLGPGAAGLGDIPSAGDQVSHLILRLVIRPGDEFRKQSH